MKSGPVIFVVATPIGNLDDISLRAVKILKNVDLIAAEDTRNAKKLLSFLEIQKKEIISYQDHGEKERAEQIIKRMIAEDLSVALVSDAGTPCISDPGFRLVQLAHQSGIKVHPVPGASSVMALASASGLPTNKLTFVGFLPNKEKALQQEIKSWSLLEGHSVVFFDSTRRLKKSLQEILEVFPKSEIAIGRELTKLYEDIFYGSISEAVEWVQNEATLKGEVVCMIYIAKNEHVVSEESIREKAKKDFKKGSSLKDLLIKYKESGLSKNELYQLLLEVKRQGA